MGLDAVLGEPGSTPSSWLTSEMVSKTRMTRRSSVLVALTSQTSRTPSAAASSSGSVTARRAGALIQFRGL